MNFWVSYIFIEQNNNRIWHPFLQIFGGRIWSRSPSSLLTDPRNHEQMICNLDTLQSHVKHPKASNMVRCSTIGLIVIHDISGQLIINPQPELFRPFWVLFPYYLLGWAPRVGRYKLPSKSSQKNRLVIFLVQIMYTGCIHSVNTSMYIYTVDIYIYIPTWMDCYLVGAQPPSPSCDALLWIIRRENGDWLIT